MFTLSKIQLMCFQGIKLTTIVILSGAGLLSILNGCGSDGGGGDEPDLAQNEAKANFSGAVDGEIKSMGKPTLFINSLGDYGIGYFLGWQSKSGDSVLLVIGGRELPVDTGEISFADPSTNYQNYPEQIAYAFTFYEGKRWISTGNSGTLNLTVNSNSRIKGTFNNTEMTPLQSPDEKTIKLNGAFNTIKKITNAEISLKGAIQKNVNAVIGGKLNESDRATSFSLLIPSPDSTLAPSKLVIGIFHEGALSKGTFKAGDAANSPSTPYAAVGFRFDEFWESSDKGTLVVKTSNDEKIAGQIKDFVLSKPSTQKTVTINGEFEYYR